MSPILQKMEHHAKILQTKKHKWTSESLTLSHSSLPVLLLLKWIWPTGQTQHLSALGEKKRAWQCSSWSKPAVTPCPSSQLLALWSGQSAGPNFLLFWFFLQLSQQRVMKHLQWELQLLLSPLQTFCGQIQNLMVSSGFKINLDQSFWVPFLWKESNLYMQTLL